MPRVISDDLYQGLTKFLAKKKHRYYQVAPLIGGLAQAPEMKPEQPRPHQPLPNGVEAPRNTGSSPGEKTQ